MKVINIVLTTLIVLLSVAAGLAKVTQVPQEVEFLTGLGFNPTLILIFGFLQIVGGILTAIPITKLFGSAIVVIGFLVSAALVLVNGNVIFGLISMIPVIITGFIMYQAVINSRKPFNYA